MSENTTTEFVWTCSECGAEDGEPHARFCSARFDMSDDDL